MADHELKTLPPYFDQVRTGRKTFELRRDDRGFAVGDVLRLREWQPETLARGRTVGPYTGREVRVRVTYILRDGQDLRLCGLHQGYVVLGIEPADEAHRLSLLRSACAEAGLRVLTAEQARSLDDDLWSFGINVGTPIRGALRGDGGEALPNA